jgi:hypothetical protein
MVSGRSRVIFSEYPEDEPTRIAPDQGTAASSQTNSTTPARRRGHVTLLGNENTNHDDGQALVSPNSPTRPQAADALPPSDLASHRPRGRTSSIYPDHGSTSDSYTRDSTPRDEGRATRLSDYLSDVSPSTEEVEAWNRAPTTVPVDSNTRLNSPHNSLDYDENQGQQKRRRWQSPSFEGCRILEADEYGREPSILARV